MRHLKFPENPYSLLLFTGIVLSLPLIFIAFAKPELQGKTMFSIPVPVFVWILPSFLFLFWLLYLVTKKFLYSMSFTWTHILITAVTSILMGLILGVVLNLTPARFSIESSEDTREWIGNTTMIVFILFIGGQCSYFVNVLLGLSSRRRHVVKGD